MSKFISMFSSLMPFWLKYTIKAIPSYFYDYIRFYKYSSFIKNDDKISMTATLIHDYHIIEKGLTMPETRLGFGRNCILSLIYNCIRFVNLHGYDEEQLLHAIMVINEYKKYHEQNKYELDNDLKQSIDKLNRLTDNMVQTTQKSCVSSVYFKDVNSSFSEFSWSRSSIRNYLSIELSIEQLSKAIDIARNTPSACNRQASRVYIISKKEQMCSILELQGGSRGFGHLASKLIIITADLGVYFGVNERYQAYVDGGMFSMNLLYALHYQKIAACILNCSNTYKKDKAMRKLCPIKKSEVFIAMICCGHAPEEFMIALSPRSSLEKYMTIV